MIGMSQKFVPALKGIVAISQKTDGPLRLNHAK